MFITLTWVDAYAPTITINIKMIGCFFKDVAGYDDPSQKPGSSRGTRVFPMGSDPVKEPRVCWIVKETVDEIKQMIQDAETRDHLR